MAEPKVSQQNIVQSITLRPPACLFPVVQAGAIRPGHLPPLVCAVLLHMYRCFQRWTGVSMGTLTPYSTICNQVAIMLSEPVSTYLATCASSSVGSDNTVYPLLPTHITESLVSVAITVSPVHRLSILVGSNHCRLGAPKTWSFRDALTQWSSHHNWAQVKVTQILTVDHFAGF